MSDSDIPELDNFDIQPEMPFLDHRQLQIGDPAVEFDEQNLEKALSLKQQATRSDDPEEALNLITNSIIMFPNTASFLNCRAGIFLKLGELNLSIRDAELSIQRAGATFAALKLLGKAHFTLREFERAQSYLKQAKQYENDDEIDSMLGQCKEQMGHMEEQIKQQQQQAKEETVKQQKQAESAPRSKYDSMNDEIQQKYGTNAAYQSDLFKNLFGTAQHMTDEKAEQLLQNEVLMQALNSDDFNRKLEEVAKDPSAAAKYAGDKDFMKAFGQILNQFK